MNKDLEYLLNTGDVVRKRTLNFYIGETSVAYTTEYSMNTQLGPFVWYLTWKDPECKDTELPKAASIYIHDARARMYFPAYLDTRIPPANREKEQLDYLMKKFGLKEYDKFDFVIATKGSSPIKLGLVREVPPKDCPYDTVHAIEEIVEEYQRVL